MLWLLRKKARRLRNQVAAMSAHQALAASAAHG
jgi:hypothetical protein